MGKGRRQSVIVKAPKNPLLHMDPLKIVQNPEIPFCEFCGSTEDTKLCSGCYLVAYCSKEHQHLRWPAHREDCRTAQKCRAPNSFKLEIWRGSPTGRKVRANRDIEKGEIILEEPPLFHYSPPSTVTVRPLGQCVSCGNEVQSGATITRCPICKWPCCSTECAEAPIHSKYECRVFELNAVKYPEYEHQGSRVKRNRKNVTKSTSFESCINENNDDDDDDEEKDVFQRESHLQYKRRRDNIAYTILKVRGYAMWNQEKKTTWRKLLNIIPMLYQRMKEDAGFMTFLDKTTAGDDAYSSFHNHMRMSTTYRESMLKLERAFPLLPKSDQIQAQHLENMMFSKFQMTYGTSVSFHVRCSARKAYDTVRTYIYHTASHFENSCAPNCSWSVGPFPDCKIRIRAAVRIKKGAELTVYRLGDLYRGTGYRQSMMGPDHRICCCSLCLDPTENGTFQSIIWCPKCLQRAERSSKGNENGDGKMDPNNNGFLLRFNPVAKTSKERLTTPLDILSLTKAKNNEAHAWTCYKCGDIRYVSEVAVHQQDIKFASQQAASFQGERLENIFKTLYFEGVGKILTFCKYNVEFCLTFHECHVVPEFPKWPTNSQLPEHIVQYYYIEAICRHSFLIQLLDKTQPGLQHERIHIALKLGIGLLIIFDHLFPNSLDQHEDNASLFKVLSEKSLELWDNKLSLCVNYLEECLLYWKGAWPSKEGKLDILVENIRGKIQLAKTFQQFFASRGNSAAAQDFKFNSTTSEKVDVSGSRKKFIILTSIFLQLEENFANVYAYKNHVFNDLHDDHSLIRKKESKSKSNEVNKSFPKDITAVDVPNLDSSREDPDSHKTNTNSTTKVPVKLKSSPETNNGENTRTVPKSASAVAEQTFQNTMTSSCSTKEVKDSKTTTATEKIPPTCVTPKSGTKERPEGTKGKGLSEFLQNFTNRFPQKRVFIKKSIISKNHPAKSSSNVFEMLDESKTIHLKPEESKTSSCPTESFDTFTTCNFQSIQISPKFTENINSKVTSENPTENPQVQVSNPNPNKTPSETFVQQNPANLRFNKTDPKPVQKSKFKLNFSNKVSQSPADEKNPKSKDPVTEFQGKSMNNQDGIKIPSAQSTKTRVHISSNVEKSSECSQNSTTAADIKSKITKSPKSCQNPNPKPHRTKRNPNENTSKTVPEQQQQPPSKCSASEVVLNHWNFYVSKLPSQAESSHLITYLENQGMYSVSAEKLPQKQEQYASFHIQFDAPHNIQGDDPRFWPSGSIVQHWSVFETQSKFNINGQRQ